MVGGGIRLDLFRFAFLRGGDTVPNRFRLARPRPTAKRLVCFASVGACATGLQVVVLAFLEWCGMSALPANMIGSVAGAQLSFMLSKRIVWGDRANNRAQWLKFYTTAALAMVVSNTVFVLTTHLHVSSVVASLCGVAAGSCLTFFVNDKLTFGRVAVMQDALSLKKTAVFDFDLSIVIPAFMEARRIADTLKRVAEYVTAHDLGKVQVVVVSADSPDGTASVARKYAQLFDNFVLVNAGPKVGKGRDVALGMLYARGRYRVFFDADLATPLHHLQQVQQFIEDGGTVGVGVRNVGHYHNTITRNLLSRMASLVARILIAPNVRDTQCGFKVFRADVAESLFGQMRIMGWNSDMEIIALARKHRHRIATFAIPDWTDPKEHEEGMAGDSILDAIMRGAIEPFLIRLRIWTGKYGTPGPIHEYMQTVSAEFSA